MTNVSYKRKMWKIGFVYLSLMLGLVATLPYDPYIDIPFKRLKTSAERIREHGYPAESHYVDTKDGYVLNVFRIPYSPKLKNQANKDKPVVFIMHGLFSCSDCFLLNGPDNALAYNFADAGFDVWLGNARGNIYSRNNTKISLKHPYFWRFSWHEIGVIDLPAMIDYALEKSGQKSLHYVGHSQGTTVFFVMSSSIPAYNEKITTAHMLAPPVFMGNVSEGLVPGLAPYVGTPGSVYVNLLDNQQILPQNPYIQRLIDTACGGKPTFPIYCKTLFLLWAGPDQNKMNATLMPQLAETHPAGSSTNQAIHYIQLYVSNEFRQYDHGVKQNRKLYGQDTPPDYALSKISAPIFLYYGLADDSANAQDVQRLPEHITTIELLREIEDPTWGHLDFLFAMQVKEVINDPVINACLDYENKRKTINQLL